MEVMITNVSAYNLFLVQLQYKLISLLLFLSNAITPQLTHHNRLKLWYSIPWAMQIMVKYKKDFF